MRIQFLKMILKSGDATIRGLKGKLSFDYLLVILDYFKWSLGYV
jgi:hypothetical protein